MNEAIAIVGMACRYPDAGSPAELWDNVLAQRRAFRRMPSERLCLEDYYSPDRSAADCTYSSEAAVLEGYEFDRVRFKVVGSTYRSADLAHWLALDVASEALADAGCAEGRGLDLETVGVVLGNTLTGEFSRASLLRNRWPYVRRILEEQLIGEGWSGEKRGQFLAAMEVRYKEPFAPIGDESLAGGLSNTIAGRICNQFDFKGGGFTVDGACCSSLLAVTQACSALVGGDLDVALAGGVDLSLDPFEIIGFAKVGALAGEDMRVYDSRSDGFWPGEGCGFLVLMRHEDALAQGRRIYAMVRGWGVSSDGSGGLTRPEEEGQLLALKRAYRRAGFGIDTLGYVEGHGTGTSVGDETELRTLSRARREAGGGAVVISSVKGNIGHTKAAAGVAGLIKAAMAVHTQVLPPATGCEQPHSELQHPEAVLRVLKEPQAWPADLPLRAGVSAMGFGGINTHVVLEGGVTERRRNLTKRERLLRDTPQDGELFLLGGETAGALKRQVEHLTSYAGRLARSELTDLAAALGGAIPSRVVRAAVVASRPMELKERLELLGEWLEEGVTSRIDFGRGLFLGAELRPPRVGFLFPGQGSPANLDGGMHRRRFESVRALYGRSGFDAGADGVATLVAQPAIVTASVAGLFLLESLGVEASVGVGHSLGELSALYWAGVWSEEAVVRIAAARGKTMAELGNPTGAMAGIGAGADRVAALLNGESVRIAGYNSPTQTVVSGSAPEVARVVGRARREGLRAVELAVSHAFHSPLVAAASPVLGRRLAEERFAPARRTVVSTVTGAVVEPEADLIEMLCRQVTSPVRFIEAIEAANREKVDLWIEVGPGQVLGGLVGEIGLGPVVSLDAGGSSMRGLLLAVGAGFALGSAVKPEALFADRFTRPFDLDWRPKFFVNPCEEAPVFERPEAVLPRPEEPGERAERPLSNRRDEAGEKPLSVLELVRELVAQRAELPATAVGDESRLLTDLHLNSISVGQVVAEAARRLQLAAPAQPTDYAKATVKAVATALEELRRTGVGGAGVAKRAAAVQGVSSWIRSFVVQTIERPRGPVRGGRGAGRWKVISAQGHPWSEGLGEALERAELGGGVAVCLGEEPIEAQAGRLLEGAREVMGMTGKPTFLLVQPGEGAGGFARTLHLETGLATCVVTLPLHHPEALDWVVSETSAAKGYVEARFDGDGVRREPRLRLLPEGEADGIPLGAEDVLLVTGGGKGIAAECALALGRRTGVRLFLLGRSLPEDDGELRANLERIRAAGIECRYDAVDVTDAEGVRKAVAEAERDWGSVTGVLHGAGTNTPELLGSLEEAAFQKTLSPKLQGARNVLAAVNREKLRVFVTFGSIIARLGLRGEADYAVANEGMTCLTERFAASHPRCRCLALEWSVWSGVGMGQRLGRVDALMEEGITPIPPDEGVRILVELLGRRLREVAVVVAGRFGDPDTLRMEKPELPLWRFLEQPRVFYPGIELVVDVELSPEADPYVEEHVYHGERLFPAVMGLEAMAQAARALVEAEVAPVFEDVRLTRPVVVAREGTTAIRLAALVTGPGEVEVALRTENTGFQTDHFRARCRFDAAAGVGLGLETREWDEAPVALDMEKDVYRDLLFHTGRFVRIRNYRLLRAKEVIAQLEADGEISWFGRYLPQEKVLGDAGVRDAAIHAVQASIPHARLLPVGVERVTVGRVPCLFRRGSGEGQAAPLVLWARQIRQEGDTFVYELRLLGEGGSVLELWEGVELRRVESISRREPWPEPLIGPYVERRLAELLPDAGFSIVLGRRDEMGRSEQSDLLIEQLTGPGTIRRRPDGKPEATGPVSLAHAEALSMAVSGNGVVGCDLELVRLREPETWKELLGEERWRLAFLIEAEDGGGIDGAGTRVWMAMECLKKAGARVDGPLVFDAVTEEGWVMLRAGGFMIATVVLAVRGWETPLGLAFLTGRMHAGL